MIIIEVKVSIEKKVIVVVVKKFVVRIRAPEPNLFGLVARVSYYRAYKQELK